MPWTDNTARPLWRDDFDSITCPTCRLALYFVRPLQIHRATNINRSVIARKHTLLPALLALVWTGTTGCEAENTLAPSPATPPAANGATGASAAGEEVAPGVRLVGRVAHPRLAECSGIVASRQYPGTFWVHNDGGGPRRQVLYAIRRSGETQAEFNVVDAMFGDWEDIAIDDQHRLYLGDIGNNDARRNEIAVHQVDEPNPAGPPGPVHVRNSWRLRYPGPAFDAEGLFVWKEFGYVVSKVFKDERAELYRFPLASTQKTVTLEFVARTKIESPVTAADISADGSRLALMAKAGAYLFEIEGDIARVNKAKGSPVKFRHEHIEGCTFVPEGLLAVAESREIFLFTDPVFRAPDGR